MCVSSSETDTQRFQADINLLYSTAASWGLSMHLKKCAAMRFRRGFHPTTRPVYYLIIDDDPRVHEQARAAKRKASGVVHTFLNATLCRDPDFEVQNFQTHIRPVLEYASVEWNTGYTRGG